MYHLYLGYSALW